MKPLRVLVVDDSAVVRKLLSDALRAEPEFEVVGGAGDPFVARDMILRLEPDVLTLDIEMPRMDGLSFLKRLMAHRPMPVIIISSVTQAGSSAAVEALRSGAVDVIPKPGGPYSVGQVADRLKDRLRGLRHARPKQHAIVTAAADRSTTSAFTPAAVRNGLIVVGASTGGPQALEALLTRLPAVTPPIVIVQHMPAQFTRPFAERLNGVCALRVLESQGGEALESGTAYVAPGDRHLVLERHGMRIMTRLTDTALVHHQRPAVDVLFASAARLKGVATVAVLLTGMGADGADGMVALRGAGAETIAEDEHSCVVFGMPRAAIERGGAMHVSTLLRIPSLIAESMSRVAVKAAS